MSRFWWISVENHTQMNYVVTWLNVQQSIGYVDNPKILWHEEYHIKYWYAGIQEEKVPNNMYMKDTP